MHMYMLYMHIQIYYIDAYMYNVCANINGIAIEISVARPIVNVPLPAPSAVLYVQCSSCVTQALIPSFVLWAHEE